MTKIFECLDEGIIIVFKKFSNVIYFLSWLHFIFIQKKKSPWETHLIEKVTWLNLLKITVVLSINSFDKHLPSSPYILSVWMWISQGKSQAPSLPDTHGLILAQPMDFLRNSQSSKTLTEALLSLYFWKIIPESSRWSRELLIPITEVDSPSKNIWAAMFVTTVKSSHLALTLAPATQLCQVSDP